MYFNWKLKMEMSVASRTAQEITVNWPNTAEVFGAGLSLVSVCCDFRCRNTGNQPAWPWGCSFSTPGGCAPCMCQVSSVINLSSFGEMGTYQRLNGILLSQAMGSKSQIKHLWNSAVSYLNQWLLIWEYIKIKKGLLLGKNFFFLCSKSVITPP